VKKHHRFLFFAGWLLINLLQAATTQLFDDEAYYWVYSRFPAWGYFDHPPMIAILIKAGYSIFQNEFGVRLFIVLLNALTIFFISQLIDKRNDKLFYAISISIAVAHVGGMIAVPDVPLLFFVTLFFLAYRNFLQQTNWLNSLYLAISIALMAYTKYHGVLIVFFTLLSNPKLFTRYHTYGVAALALAFFVPHLYWQYIHDFPSVQFHLFERNARSYRVTFTLEYVATQLLFAGPVIGWLLMWSAIRYKPLTATEKALHFTLIGSYIFFLISTLKGRSEANWTLPAFVGLIALSHQYLKERPNTSKWIYRTLPFTLIIVAGVRVFMMLDMERSYEISKDEIHGNQVWAKSVSDQANGLPVVFLNTYQWASKYWFYSGQPALGMNTPYYRRNNFNYWPIEDNYFGKPAYVIGDYDTVVLKNEIKAPRVRRTGSAIIPVYYSFMKAQFSQIENKVSPGMVNSSFKVNVPERYLSHFQRPPFDTASVQLAILNIADTIKYFPSTIRVKLITQVSSNLSVNFAVHLPKGMYDAKLGISSGIPGHPTLNSLSFKIKID
jgi:hypothetical protein